MRVLVFFVLMMAVNGLSAQGLFVESNFADNHFTVKAKALDVTDSTVPGAFDFALITELEVLDVYHGDLAKGDTVKLIIESDILNAFYRRALMQGEFLTSFCVSDTGIYYTNVIFSASAANVQALEKYRDHGTESWDRHDCAYARNESRNPDDLYYIAPVERYPGSHSNHKWRKDIEFMAAFQAAVVEYETEEWVRSFDGIGHSRKRYDIEGEQWLYMELCELEDCQDHNLSLLYNEQKAKVFALINTEKTFFTGAPSQEMRTALIALHDADDIEKRLYDPAYYGVLKEKRQQARKDQSGTSKTINTLIDVYRKM